MLTTQARQQVATWSFWIFVLAFAALVVHGSQFGIIDDSRLLDTISAGQRLPWFIEPSIGRFAPLQGQEYNVIAIIARSPFAFFVLNGIELLAAAWLLVRIGRSGSTSKQTYAPYIVAVCVMLLPGFTESWLRLFVPERTEFLCISGFFLSYLTFRKTKEVGFFVSSLFWAALTLFCKETGFVLVGGFGFFDFVLNRDSDVRSTRRLLDVLLLSLSCIWLIAYYLLSYRFRGKYLYGAQAGSSLHALLRTLGATLLHDPLLALVLGLAGFLLLLRKKRVDALLVVCVCTMAALIASYLTLHMSNNYYLLPAYALLPFVVCSILAEPRWRALIRNPLVVGVFGVLIANQSIVGLQQLTLWRTDPQQFQKMLPVLSEKIKHSAELRQSIFLAGVDAGNSIEFYTALGAYLQNRGISPQRFDLKSAEPILDPVTWMRIVPLLPSRDFSFEQTMVPQPVLPRDLVLVTAASSAAARQQLEDASQYRCIYRTEALSYSNLTLKRIARTIVSHGRPGVDDRIDPNYAIYERL